MCLIVFAWNTHPRYHLVLAANRDEYLLRPTKALDYWHDEPTVFGGRDEEKGGSWLASNTRGCWAAVTNFRDGRALEATSLSRGHLVSQFVTSIREPEDYADAVAPSLSDYAGCNLLLGSRSTLVCVSNRHATFPATRVEAIKPGIHGLSNHLLNTPWPKVIRAKQALQHLLECDGTDLEEGLFSVLSDRESARDVELPDTGIPSAQERKLSAPFIVAEGYGTRASSVLLIGHDGSLRLHERTFGAGGVELSRHSITIAKQ